MIHRDPLRVKQPFTDRFVGMTRCPSRFFEYNVEARLDVQAGGPTEERRLSAQNVPFPRDPAILNKANDLAESVCQDQKRRERGPPRGKGKVQTKVMR